MADIKLDGLTVASSSGSPTAISLNSAVDIKANLNATGDAPIYECRAWVNFRGSSMSGTLNTSGPVTGLYTATVTSATTFTIEYSSTTYTVTTSGNHDVGDGEGVDLTISGTSVTIDTQIRESGNVSSITDNGGVGGDYTINFTTAMPDTNYATVGAGSNNSGNSYTGIQIVSQSTTGVSVQTWYAAQDKYDALFVPIAIFR